MFSAGVRQLFDTEVRSEAQVSKLCVFRLLAGENAVIV